jgi:hypothetical protein
MFGGESKTLDQALISDWIKSPFYRWTGQTYDWVSSGGTFQPTSGYWVKALQTGCKLVFSKP